MQLAPSPSHSSAHRQTRINLARKDARRSKVIHFCRTEVSSAMSLHKCGVLGTLAILPVAAQVYNDADIPPEIRVEASSNRHALADARIGPDGSITSPGWSGYVVAGAVGSVMDIKGSWTVPAATCSGSGSTYFSEWVGIDGWNGSTTVEQIGTASQCLNGTPNYYAWYEFFPAAAVPIKYKRLPIRPGDRVSAEVAYSGGIFNVTITDERAGSPFSASATVPAAQRLSAEWIAEAPEISNVIQPLADFGTGVYGADYTDIANTCSATIGTQSGPIGSLPGWFPVTMANNGTIEAIPSPLSLDGSSFSVTWQGLTTLASLSANDRSNAPPIQGLDGNFYGTTYGGGANGYGTIFRMTPAGALTTMHSFGMTNGATPFAALLQATNGISMGRLMQGAPTATARFSR